MATSNENRIQNDSKTVHLETTTVESVPCFALTPFRLFIIGLIAFAAIGSAVVGVLTVLAAMPHGIAGLAAMSALTLPGGMVFSIFGAALFVGLVITLIVRKYCCKRGQLVTTTHNQHDHNFTTSTGSPTSPSSVSDQERRLRGAEHDYFEAHGKGNTETQTVFNVQKKSFWPELNEELKIFSNIPQRYNEIYHGDVMDQVYFDYLNEDLKHLNPEQQKLLFFFLLARDYQLLDMDLSKMQGNESEEAINFLYTRLRLIDAKEAKERIIQLAENNPPSPNLRYIRQVENPAEINVSVLRFLSPKQLRTLLQSGSSLTEDLVFNLLPASSIEAYLYTKQKLELAKVDLKPYLSQLTAEELRCLPLSNFKDKEVWYQTLVDNQEKVKRLLSTKSDYGISARTADILDAAPLEVLTALSKRNWLTNEQFRLLSEEKQGYLLNEKLGTDSVISLSPTGRVSVFTPSTPPPQMTPSTQSPVVYRTTAEKQSYWPEIAADLGITDATERCKQIYKNIDISDFEYHSILAVGHSHLSETQQKFLYRVLLATNEMLLDMNFIDLEKGSVSRDALDVLYIRLRMIDAEELKAPQKVFMEFNPRLLPETLRELRQTTFSSENLETLNLYYSYLPALLSPYQLQILAQNGFSTNLLSALLPANSKGAYSYTKQKLEMLHQAGVNFTAGLNKLSGKQLRCLPLAYFQDNRLPWDEILKDQAKVDSLFSTDLQETDRTREILQALKDITLVRKLAPKLSVRCLTEFSKTQLLHDQFPWDVFMGKPEVARHMVYLSDDVIVAPAIPWRMLSEKDIQIIFPGYEDRKPERVAKFHITSIIALAHGLSSSYLRYFGPKLTDDLFPWSDFITKKGIGDNIRGLDEEVLKKAKIPWLEFAKQKREEFDICVKVDWSHSPNLRETEKVLRSIGKDALLALFEQKYLTDAHHKLLDLEVKKAKDSISY